MALKRKNRKAPKSDASGHQGECPSWRRPCNLEVLHLGLPGRVSGGEGGKRYCWMKSLISVFAQTISIGIIGIQMVLIGGIVLVNFFRWWVLSLFSLQTLFRFWASQLHLLLFHLTHPLHHPLLQKASLRWRWRLN